MPTLVFDRDTLKKCTTESQVLSYFEELNFTSYEQKIQALTQTMDTSGIEYLGDVSLENQYQTLLTLFLDEEFRWLKGIF